MKWGEEDDNDEKSEDSQVCLRMMMRFDRA